MFKFKFWLLYDYGEIIAFSDSISPANSEQCSEVNEGTIRLGGMSTVPSDTGHIKYQWWSFTVLILRGWWKLNVFLTRYRERFYNRQSLKWDATSESGSAIAQHSNSECLEETQNSSRVITLWHESYRNRRSSRPSLVAWSWGRRPKFSFPVHSVIFHKYN